MAMRIPFIKEKPDIRLRFLGAAGTVTGSKYHVEVGDAAFMVDGGLFQGEKSIRLRNWEPLPVDLSRVSTLLLTHAHIDHTGYLPCICRDGFRGRIISTHPTVALCDLLLRDSAHLQEEQAEFVNRKKVTKHSPALPLYTTADAESVSTRMSGVRFDEPFDVVPGVTGRFRNAGHILGAAWLELTCAGRKLVFSGDLGRTSAPLLRDPDPLESADFLVLESTYGNRLHGSHDTEKILAEVVGKVVRDRGVLVIPAFAVERTQEIVYLLQQIHRDQQIPNIPVFVDSPMAVRATRLFDDHLDLLDEDAARIVEDTSSLFQSYPNLHLCESVEMSKAIAKTPNPKIVIAASGMAVGGRILHHLRAYLPDPRNTVLLVGYQSVGSRGWRLQEGEKEIKIFGEWVPVRAKIARLDGFSGHADYQQILAWMAEVSPRPKRVFLTHGDPGALEAQRARLDAHGWDVHVPDHLEEVIL